MLCHHAYRAMISLIASVEVNAGDGEVSFNTRTCGRFDPCSDHGMVADVIAALASLRDV